MLDFWKYISPTAESQLEQNAAEGKKAGIYQIISFHLFCRMLAKIAHSFAVATCGLGSFEPFLPDVILGRSLAVSHYVGGSIDIPALPPPAQKVNLDHRLRYGELRSHNGDRLLVVGIHLFAVLGAPIYEVIVGSRSGKQLL